LLGCTYYIKKHCCPARVKPHRAVDLVKPDAVEDGIINQMASVEQVDVEEP
jgi:hypothetical protein